MASGALSNALVRPIRVYVVDDEPLIHNVWRRLLSGSEFDVRAFLSARDALQALARDPDADVLVTDLAMPEMDGLELLKVVKAERPEIEVVVMTANVGLEKAMAAVKQGAYQFLPKPFDADQPPQIVRQAAGRKRAKAAAARPAAAPVPGTQLVGASAELRQLAGQVEAAARAGATVMVVGEHGSGRALVARAIHLAGPRRDRPFVVVGCGSLEGSLLEGELFGYLGANGPRPGVIESADGGTIVLDDIGQAPASVQTRLLGVVERGEVRPVGASTAVRVDVRIITTAAASPEVLARQGRLREDLAFRLAVVTIDVPPLRARRDDIPVLARHFLAQAAARHGREVVEFEPAALEALAGWSWPGNVRELENVVERAVILGRERKVTVGDLPPGITAARRGVETGAPAAYTAARRRAMEDFDRAFVEGMLARTGGNISEAARLAGLDRANFRRIMRRVAAR